MGEGIELVITPNGSKDYKNQQLRRSTSYASKPFSLDSFEENTPQLRRQAQYFDWTNERKRYKKKCAPQISAELLRILSRL